MKLLILLFIFCSAIVNAQTLTIGECKGEMFLNGKKTLKAGTNISGKNSFEVKENSRLSLMTPDGDVTITLAPGSKAEISFAKSGININMKTGTVLVSCYSDNITVQVISSTGKRFSVKDAELLLSCKGKKELVTTTDGVVKGVSENRETEKKIRKEFELKRVRNQETKRNAPLFDENSARPGQ